MSHLCLTMVVRDEAEWIEPLIESALGLGIDDWLIADTGSEDDTMEVVQDLLASVPGTMLELPWERQAKTRTELLGRAHSRKADYLLMVDADMTLTGELVELKDDVYDGIVLGRIEYALPILLKGDIRWEYRGAAHSYLARADDGHWQGLDSGIRIVDRRPGGWREGKIEEDVLALEAELERNPADARSSFYLAQSYSDCDRVGDAIREYSRRLLLSGWIEERYMALLRRGRLLASRGEGASALADYLAAWHLIPTRAEAVYAAARQCRIEGWNESALIFAREAVQIARPGYGLFLEDSVYRYGCKVELGIAEIRTNSTEKGKRRLLGLRKKEMPEAVAAWIDEILEEET